MSILQKCEHRTGRLRKLSHFVFKTKHRTVKNLRVSLIFNFSGRIINVRVNGYSVDLVPGQRQGSYGDDHSLYRRKRDTWIKTNVATHIRHVVLAGRQRESRIIKLWRDQKRLDFPSFYLELAVIDALPWQVQETLSGNVWRVFEYLKNRVQIARIVDPANTNNIVSDDLSIADKSKISTAAASALGSNWNEIVI
jgi:hypothetical protein